MEGERINVVKGLASALCYMCHECSYLVIHRDILSNNITSLEAHYEAHRVDFQMARILEPNSSCTHSSFAGNV